MDFFLLNLALLDLGCISTTLPKAMTNALWDTRAISYQECAAQVFFFAFLITAEFYVLTITAYDRYAAICKPLHYGSVVGSRACNAVDQFFCEIPQILKLSCSRSDYLKEVSLLVVSACLAFGCFVFIVVSYVLIFRAVLRMPSEQGQHKAFSTCLPHLAMVSLFLCTVIVAYLKPPSMSSPSLDLVFSFLYSVVPLAVNPLIYSMRNQDLKEAVRKLFGHMLL
ncbi:olfactory receptor 14J1-like [Anser cygnoides]|uniref:olfactory receptor 14J1-like n=1 Tax=Anser cygnoides TaxID=8845 RepID=UPI0034D3726E